MSLISTSSFETRNDDIRRIGRALALLMRNDPDADVRCMAYSVSFNVEESTDLVPIARAGLADPDEKVQETVALWLGSSSPDNDATEELVLEVLSTRNESHQSIMLTSMGSVARKGAFSRSIRDLVETLTTDPNDLVRMSAIRTQIRMLDSDEEQIAYVLNALRSHDARIRYAALNSVQNAKNLMRLELVTSIVHALDDPDDSVAFAASGALDRLDDIEGDDTHESSGDDDPD